MSQASPAILTGPSLFRQCVANPENGNIRGTERTGEYIGNRAVARGTIRGIHHYVEGAGAFRRESGVGDRYDNLPPGAFRGSLVQGIANRYPIRKGTANIGAGKRQRVTQKGTAAGGVVDSGKQEGTI